MFKNVASQKLTVFAFDATTSLPKTGDAANLTAYLDKDDAGLNALTDTSAAEIDATNAKGYYRFDVSQSESNADKILFTCKSSTANIVVVAVPAVVYTVPPNFTALVIDSSGNVVLQDASLTAAKIAADAITAAKIATGAIDADALAADAVAEIADGVWDEALAGHLGAGSTGAALNAASSAGDPWATALPGAYGAGTAGKIVGDFLDAAISDVLTDTLTLLTRLTGTRASNLDNLDAAISAVLTAIDAVPTAAENATGLLDVAAGVETNRTVRQALRIILAAMAGKLSGAATTEVTIRDTNDTKDRIVAEVDSDGNRLTVTLDGT